MKLSLRERILLIIVSVLALGAVYYFYFLTPYLKEMSEIQKDIDAKKVEFDMLSLQSGQLKVLDEQIEKLKTENKDHIEKLPIGFDQPEVLVFLHQLISQNAVKASFNFDPPKDFQKIDSMRASLNFYTDYTNLKKIVESLKACKFNNRIVTLTVSFKPEKPETETDNEAEEKTEVTELDTGSYGLQVVLIAEFFNLKGEVPDKSYDFDTGAKGKADLFS